MRPISLRSIFLLLVCSGGLVFSGEVEHQVQAKDELVRKNDKIDKNDEETVQAEASTFAGGRITVLSRTFTPPNAMVFILFPRSTTHVDIAKASNMMSADRLQDTAQRIKIREVFTKPANAGTFRMKAEGNLSPTGGQGGTPPELHWSVKVPECTIDLVIHNGQGGPPISEADEETIGAFTVANLNDTDGDGEGKKVDKDDDSVKASAKGRNEVDLMALDINPPVPAFEGTVTLKVEGDSVRFWKESTKETEIKKLEFNVADLPQTIWVEVTKPSNKVRDIVIRAEHPGCQDTVKATGVWAKVTAVAHDRQSAVDLFAEKKWADFTTPPKDRIEFFGGVGLRPINGTIGVRNVIAIQFTVQPSGVQNEPKVNFDITRQIEAMGWDQTGTNPPEVVFSRTFQVPDEEANDDPVAEGDESNYPNVNDHFYVEDAPGRVSDIAGSDLSVLRFNFREFVRVKFDDTKPTGNTVDGSRCSDKFDWHARHRLINRSGKWVRSTGDDRESGENDIGPKHITIGTAP